MSFDVRNAEIVRLYKDENWSVQAIGLKYALADDTIVAILKTREIFQPQHTNTQHPDRDAFVLAMLAQGEITNMRIAELAQISKDRVRHILQSYNDPRKAGSQRVRTMEKIAFYCGVIADELGDDDKDRQIKRLTAENAYLKRRIEQVKYSLDRVRGML